MAGLIYRCRASLVMMLRYYVVTPRPQLEREILALARAS